MGSSVSAGVDNNELVDNLLEGDYIKTPSVERVFRAVDRGMYFPDSYRESAYKDLAWKSGNVHLSAPCIYCEVMENLNLGPGMSFLNLGSGTGYLSTMAGLILGSFGTNHGVEIHPDVVGYALRKLEEFKKSSAAIDEFDFCEPKFVQGNCLLLDSVSMKYDRVYCGAACPVSYESYMKNLIKVGGILVLPLHDRLLRIKRISETSWETRSVLPVAFSNLREPSTGSTVVVLPLVEPISLMETCRTAIRGILKAVIDKENPELKVKSLPANRARKQRTLQRVFIPMFGDSESFAIMSTLERAAPEGDSDDNSTHTASALEESGHFDGISLDHPLIGSTSNSPENHSVPQPPCSRSSSDSDDSSNSISSSRSLFFRAMASYAIRDLTPPPTCSLSSCSVSSPVFSAMAMTNVSESSSDSSVCQDGSSDSSMDVDQSDHEKSEAICRSSEMKLTVGPGLKRVHKRKEAEIDEGDQSSSSLQRSSNASYTSTRSGNDQSRENRHAHSSKKKREKVDSGIGEDINNWDISPSDVGSELELASDTESEADISPKHSSDEKFTILHGRRCRSGNISSGKTKKGATTIQQSKQQETSAYGLWMRSKIQQLPLPPSIKLYINHHRDL